MERKIRQYEQDPTKSVTTPNGKYDFVHFSEHETEVILKVLNDIKIYPKNCRAIYLMANAGSLVYKARDVLIDAVIELAKGSSNPLDLFAAGMAYKTKGYYYRDLAKEKFDLFFQKGTIEEFRSFPTAYTGRTIYLSLAKFYEECGDYTSAVKCTLHAGKYRGIPSGSLLGIPETEWSKKRNAEINGIEEDFDNRTIARLKEKWESGCRVSPVKPMPEKRAEREKSVRYAARYFLQRASLV